MRKVRRYEMDRDTRRRHWIIRIIGGIVTSGVVYVLMLLWLGGEGTGTQLALIGAAMVAGGLFTVLGPKVWGWIAEMIIG